MACSVNGETFTPLTLLVRVHVHVHVCKYIIYNIYTYILYAHIILYAYTIIDNGLFVY